MRIAVDVMGADHGPEVIINGARMALAANPAIAKLIFVGREDEIAAAMSRCGCTDPRVSVLHASEVVTMLDKPTDAVRRKHFVNTGV